MAATTVFAAKEDSLSLINALKSYEPRVSQSTGTELSANAGMWSLADFSVGFAVGAYEHTITRAYAGDCFSTVFSFAFNNMAYSQYSDTGYPRDTLW